MKPLSLIAGIGSLLLTGGTLAAEKPVSLFDGKTFSGWEIREGEEPWWAVRDGLIVGGSLKEKVPKNTFLTTTDRYANFELRFSVRIVPQDGFINSGVQVRSIRKPDHHEMIGYQVDVGPKWWGKLYDESRRKKVIADRADSEALMAVIQETGWNHYRVLCEGPRIRTWINEVLAFDYTEKDQTIPLEGIIGLQAHGGGRFEVQYKDLSVRSLPDTPGAPAWNPPAKKAEAPKKEVIYKTIDKQLADPTRPRTPAEQLAGFTVPKGFVVELVASEEQGLIKPITVQWDARGRMWTMTAEEYPMDGNENAAAAAAKFQAGGTDRVLVFDDPYGPGPHTPRVFADGLVIPLGVLPTADGAYVQYGPEIRHYHDRDGDGKAEGYEVVLEGFGVQDSHLFPHQFERAPGGWITLAQGLFNKSTVVRPDGTPFADGSQSVRFDFCKLARFRTDASAFETLTSGPNNIWGYTHKNTGEVFLQEANDVGIPVAEYQRGIHYPTGLRERLKPYAPALPVSFEGRVMGGTGLSGLALTEAQTSRFNAAYPEAENVFYLANPIINKIQVVTTQRGPHGHHVYTKQEDFLTSEDTWFRPVAVHFGPDGCLYVVDWYNKIISHNEVPREHPDRDKTRGRIWRIRPEGQAPQPPPDLMAVPATELAGYLAHPNERIARFAWHAIADRNIRSLEPDLENLVRSASTLQARVLALWSLEDLGILTAGLLKDMAQDPAPQIRFEAVRAAGNLTLTPAEARKILEPVANDPDYRVRAEVANTIRSLPEVDGPLLRLAAELGQAPTHFGDRRDYDRDFERYLARWAMENHPKITRALLQGDGVEPLTGEPRLLAVLTLPPAEAAAALVQVAATLDRPLEGGEVRLIVSELEQASVREGLRKLLDDPDKVIPLMELLQKQDADIRTSNGLAELLDPVCRAVLAREPKQRNRVVAWIKAFRLSSLGDLVIDGLNTESSDDTVAAALGTLREIGATDLDLYQAFDDREASAVQRQVVMGLATSTDPKAIDYFSDRWTGLSGDLRQLAVLGLTRTRAQAAAFAQRAAAGGFPGLTPDLIDALGSSLGFDHPAMQQLLEATPGMIQPVIRLTGKSGDAVRTDLTLEGPFTVEAWVHFAPGIGNEDTLLGRKGGADLNFYDGQMRLHGGSGQGDLVVAGRAMQPDVWTHCAITRDAQGTFRIYHDAILDVTGTQTSTNTYTGLHIGGTNARGGSGFRIAEFRVWDRVRSAEEIQATYRTRLSGEPVDGLTLRLDGTTEDLPLQGAARIEPTIDFPDLMTREEAETARKRFETMLVQARQPGMAERGKPLFAACMACHKVGDVGGVIGPDLSGAGAMGDEALLHNILTPNAAMESGYYRHDVIRKDGTKVTGSLEQERKHRLFIRPIGGDVIAINKRDILSHTVSKTSLMPEGLIDHLSAQQVADLFAYIRTLTGGTP